MTSRTKIILVDIFIGIVFFSVCLIAGERAKRKNVMDPSLPVPVVVMPMEQITASQ